MKPTVVILTYCEHPSLAYGSLMVFETLRVGYPTFDVVVIDNGSHPDVVPLIEAAAKKANASFTATERHNFIDHYRWMICDQTQLNSFVLLDPDVVFWKNVEDWSFDGVMAGRLIPDITTGGVTSVSRLHPSHVWIPDAKRLRELGVSVELRKEENKFWDTLATIYQEHSDKCQSFTEDQLDCYDHLFYGSHFPAIEPRLKDDDLTYNSHRQAASGNMESLRGIWRDQERYFQSQKDVPFEMTSSEITTRMQDVCDELSNIQNVQSEDTVRQLLVNIQSQLPVATKEMLQMPQASCPVVHHFGPGLCIREVSMPAGTLAVGHSQKYEHTNILLRGSVMVVNDDGSTSVLKAPMIFTGKPGRKVGYVLEDMVWQNVYATDLKNPDDVESFFVEKSEDWHDDMAVKFALDSVRRTEDREDYIRVLNECGISHEVARHQSECQDDQVWIDHAIVRVDISPIEGKGLFATAFLKAGDTICPARIGGKRTQGGRYTNHSATPNAKMKMLPNGDIDLVAIADIEGCKGGSIGTEITIDYRQALGLSGIEMKKESLCQQ